MRLLRLVSKPPPTGVLVAKSEFENYFNDNIILKKGSKIGLLSASIPLSLVEIYINSSNNEFQFRTANGYTFNTVNLGVDSLYTVEEFIDAIRLATWRLFNFQTRSNDRGCMIDFHMVDSKFNIELIKSRNIPMNMDPDASFNLGIINDGVSFTRNAPLVSDNTSFVFSKLPMIPSCGYIRVQLDNVVAVNSMIFGITTDEFDQTQVMMSDDDFTHAVKIIGTGGAERYWTLQENGAYVVVDPATKIPEPNDLISLEITRGELHYVIYANNNNPPIDIGTRGIKQLRNLHFGIGLRDLTVKVFIPDVIYDPRTYLNDLGEIVRGYPKYSIYQYPSVDSGLGVPPRPPAGGQVGNATIQFTKLGLRDVLGFARNALSYTGAAQTFIADDNYNRLTIPTSILVDLPSIKLQSYDGLLGTRRNIVAIIPIQQQSKQRIEYSIANPIMMDVDNSQDISLRSIRAQVLNGNSEGELLEVFDRIELVILIDD